MDRGSFHNDRSSPTRYLGRDGIIRKRYVASSMNRFEDGEKNGESVLDFFFISPSPSLLLLQHVHRRKRRMQTSFTFRTVARVVRDCWIRFYLGMEFNEREISSRSNWYISDISRSVDERQRDGFR